jgi:crossover junction endodeoxyribonuclease RuvC
MPAHFLVAGLDPGLSGAIGFLWPASPSLVAVENLPLAGQAIDAITLGYRLEEMRPILAVVEQVSALPKQGVASTFKFGQAYGAILGVLGALRIPHQLVVPGRWKRHFRLGPDKEQARALALRTWPDCRDLSRKKDHGRAEALLLAKFGADVLLDQGGAR